MKPRELIFFRHGIAVELSDPAVPSDEERPLTEEGIRKTREAAEGLKRLQINFDKLLTSPWLRASQTAGILADVLALGTPETLPELAGDHTPNELIEALAQQTGRHMLLVGHQPLLAETVAQLLSGEPKFQIDLKKSGVCAIEVDGMPPGAPATLLWMLTSKQLRMLAK